MPTVLLLTALDTRGEEASYLRAQIESRGCKVIMVDTSMRAHEREGAEYTCAEVARLGGADFNVISKQKGTATITEPMLNGSISIVKKLHEEGAIDAIAGFGGATNTLFISTIMRVLPFGFPKLILSSSAAMPAYAARYYAFKDICIFHACLDMNGINRFVVDLLQRFAGLITGVAAVKRIERTHERTQVALTEFGFSEICAQRIRSRFASSLNFEVIPFHAQGVGDRIMEEMIGDGMFDAVIDLVPAGLSEAMLGGNRSAGLDRLDIELASGIPVIFTPCGFDALSCGPYSRRLGDLWWKEKGLLKRKLYVQDEMRVQARTTKAEMQQIAKVFAEKLNNAKGVTLVFIPLKGFSALSVEGGPLYEPETDMAFVRGLKRHLKRRKGLLELIEMDCSCEDPVFADAILDGFGSIHYGQGKWYYGIPSPKKEKGDQKASAAQAS
jgi:uncharacterized protein (UPF0261 family)